MPDVTVSRPCVLCGRREVYAPGEVCDECQHADRQPREHSVPCALCPPHSPFTWNVSGLCDKHSRER